MCSKLLKCEGSLKTFAVFLNSVLISTPVYELRVATFSHKMLHSLIKKTQLNIIEHKSYYKKYCSCIIIN